MSKTTVQEEFARFSVLTFDCYGTLIDWESGIWDALQPLLFANIESLHAQHHNRSRMLAAFAAHESAVQREQPTTLYPQILTEAHRRIAAENNFVSSSQMDSDFGMSVPYWPAFADSAEALRLLQQKFRLGILSNVDREGFAASARRLGAKFDVVCTAQDIGSYKPNPRNFPHLLSRLQQDGIGADDVLHVAQSMFHDIKPGREAGLSLAWIDRQNLSGGGDWGATAPVTDAPHPDWTFPDLLSFARMTCGDPQTP